MMAYTNLSGMVPANDVPQNMPMEGALSGGRLVRTTRDVLETLGSRITGSIMESVESAIVASLCRRQIRATRVVGC